MTSTDSQQDSDEATFTFTLEQRASNIISQQMFGLRPYIIIKPELTDDEEVVMHIEVGGGAQLQDLGEVFGGLAELLEEPEAIQQIQAAVDAAREAADEDDDFEDEPA